MRFRSGFCALARHIEQSYRAKGDATAPKTLGICTPANA
jgi:hypothetical protein